MKTITITIPAGEYHYPFLQEVIESGISFDAMRMFFEAHDRMKLLNLDLVMRKGETLAFTPVDAGNQAIMQVRSLRPEIITRLNHLIKQQIITNYEIA